MPSFDVVSEIDQQEIRNAVDQVAREVSTRYDFKGTNTTIELQPLSAQDNEQVSATMPGPDGNPAKLAPKPYKKLVIKIDTKDANGTMSSTSTIFIAEKDGKLGVALPVPAN